MNSSCNTVKIDMLSVFYLISLLSIVSCVSKPEVITLPACNYTDQISTNEQISNFIWRDKKHVIFHEDWLTSSLIEISNRYQYLQRKTLQDAVKAKNEIVWLTSELNNLQNINNDLLTYIELNLCNNEQALQSPSLLRQQNTGIAYLRAGLPDILNDIQAKKEKIISA
ncbi:MAG: hypothetical protein ACJAT7_003094, partial [Psychromonas sp.]|uniref:hypothetical protein n=1 Tax=Psychromonas sp. TaxID=1884585 RepID=UPI0039E5EBB4